jgi:hypothetical protein
MTKVPVIITARNKKFIQDNLIAKIKEDTLTKEIDYEIDYPS